MRIDLSGDSLAAAIDIPELMMVRRPLPARCRQDSLVVELPFGFGEVSLAPQTGGGWLGSRLLGGDTLRLTFARGAPPPYAVETLRIPGEAGELAADLYLPTGLRGAGPAIVMIHGSGEAGRHSLYYRSWADYYARLGIATLIYDKRGVGESSGDFRADSAFEMLTTDALAAVSYVRSRPEVDSRRVGLGGHSQAGWIAFRAAARDSGVAFLALMAVPAVSVADQEFQRIRAGMRAAGLPETHIRAAIAHMQLLFGVAVTGLGWDGLAASNARAAGEPWVEWVHRPAAPENLRWWRTHAAIDPAVDLARLRIPVFAAFSARDPVVPAAYNAGVLRMLLDSAASPTIVTVPRGDHILEISGRDETGRWRLPRLHPQVMQELRAWVARIATTQP